MWRTRRARTSAALWCHISLLLAIIMMPFYGWLHMQIHVVLIAFALAARELVDPDEPAEPLAPPEPRAYVVSESLTEAQVPALTGANGNASNVHVNKNPLNEPFIWYTWLMSEMEVPMAKNNSTAEHSRHTACCAFFTRLYPHSNCANNRGTKEKTVLLKRDSISQLCATIKTMPLPINTAPKMPNTMVKRLGAVVCLLK
jgi:hypothetical protein